MGLEATILCVDNSEFSRNGDFAPSRFAVQVDSVNMLCSAKVQANAESCVGLLTLAGRSARILITSTRDLGRIFTCMHDVKFDGDSNFIAGIQKAQLALKHRQNNLQRQRIVVFVSSPLTVETEVLVKLGKNLKKNSVSVDVINIGLEGENQAKIDAFIDAVNSHDSSRALHVPAGGPNLADALMNSDIYMERSGGGSGDGGTGDNAANDFPYGVDPSEDPELAMVLRISMEEERARQARAAQEAAESGEDEVTNNDGNKDDTSKSKGKYDDNDEDLYGTGESMDVDNDDDAEMLRRAIELSKASADPTNASSSDKKDDDDKKES
ncbi:unnamed protein product [Agarophyton chilense]